MKPPLKLKGSRTRRAIFAYKGAYNLAIGKGAVLWTSFDMLSRPGVTPFLAPLKYALTLEMLGTLLMSSSTGSVEMVLLPLLTN